MICSAFNQHKTKSTVLVLMKWKCLWFMLAGVGASGVSVIDNSVVVTEPWDIRKWDTQNGIHENKQLESTIVKTEYGDVRGYESEPDIMAFFDIPYGAFTAERPFQEPTAPEPWKELHDTPKHSSRCPQLRETKFEGSHECLTLSIFKPKQSEIYGVLFHIHDSFFVTGSGDPLIYGPTYIVPKGIVLVLPNYRLGPLGFLCLRNETAPGNAGLKDLSLALKWTMNNVEAFGGNSSNIVVSGAGAGGALVEYLLLSNDSNRFIAKAITESGSALSPWAIDRNPLETGNIFLERLTESKDALDAENILDNSHLEEIIKAGVNLTFRPCIESENGFLTSSPSRLLQNVKFTEFTSYMSGSSNQAAMKDVLQLTTEDFLHLNQNISQLLPDDLEFKSENEKTNAAQQVKTQYFENDYISKTNRERLSLCYSDSQYINSAIRAARLFAKGGSLVYFYEFSLDHMSSFNGSTRGDSLLFIFSNNTEEVTSSYKNMDTIIMRDFMTNLWSDFIKTGHPSVNNVQWESLKYGSEDSEPWLSIGSKIVMQKGLHVDRLKLWGDLYSRHYVYRNFAFDIKPSLYVAIIALTLKHFWKFL